MSGYGQYCPIALAAEVFAERWTPIVIRNLHLGCRHFGEILDGAPGMPRSVLAQRLRTLTADDVITCTRTGRTTSYELTEMGHELTEVCMALGVWGARWRAAQPEDQDPYLALWTMSRLVQREPCERPRVVVRFDVPGRGDHDRFWVVLDHVSGNEVCVEYPGYAEDGVVVCDTASLVRWYAGEVSLLSETLADRVRVSAPPWLERELERWGHLSPFAGIAPAASAVLVGR